MAKKELASSIALKTELRANKGTHIIEHRPNKFRQRFRKASDFFFLFLMRVL